MATVTLYKAFSFQTAQDWDWDITAYSSTALTISGGGHVQTFKGSLSYPSMTDVTGTVREIHYSYSGSKVYSVTGLSANASTLQTYAENAGDTQQTYAYVLKGNDTILGSGGNDVLNGYAGDDILKGNAGKDVLIGGAGKDSFVFNKALAGNMDTIKDFKPVDDTIKIDNAIFKALATTGTLKAANFKASTTGNAADSSDFILYETDTGKLFYDADGNGAGAKVQFALLGTSTHPAITAADFVVI